MLLCVLWLLAQALDRHLCLVKVLDLARDRHLCLLDPLSQHTLTHWLKSLWTIPCALGVMQTGLVGCGGGFLQECGQPYSPVFDWMKQVDIPGR